MYCNFAIFLIFIVKFIVPIKSNDVLGCGGFIKSDSNVPIDFSRIEIKLYTKQGILKDKTSCAPNNGYYFIPLYDKGEYVLQLQPPPGWSFEPTKVNLIVDGTTDLCSKGKDINFDFKGFGITGKVESFKSKIGPAGIHVQLKSHSGDDVRKTVTSADGSFFFTPVIPGKYVVTASHNKWKFLKSSVSVQVAEGNTELPSGTLVVAGYDVTGSIKSKGQLMSSIDLILFQTEGDKERFFIDGCDKTVVKTIEQPQNQLCHVSLNSDGSFIFPTISPGKYFIVPYCKERNVHFSPNIIEVEVAHKSVVLEEAFEIVGFSVSGRVLNSKNGKPLKNAKVLLNENQITTTKDDGSYSFEKITAASYKLRVLADDLEFEENIVEVNPKVLQFPDLFPSKYQVCGNVLSDKPQTVLITPADSSESLLTTSSPINNGKFCQFLNPGKYKLQVSVSDSEKAQGVQFFPSSHSLEVISSSVSGITFSQLKATVTGKVKCIQEKDCASLKVILQSPDNKDVVADIIDNIYKFDDVTPGDYKLILSSNKFCWEKDSHSITVNSTSEKAPEFVQNGYSVIFISSHSTKAKYSLSKGETKVIQISKGKMPYCIEKSGVYEFQLESCHTYESNIVTYNTDSEINEINLIALKHATTVAIDVNKNLGKVFMTVNVNDNEIREEPLIYKDKKYTLTLSLAQNEVAILTPQSDILYFKPSSVSIKGSDDCADLGVKFIAEEGKVFQGKIVPPIAGVLLTIEKDNEIITSYETTETGAYKFPPLDASKEYKISAKKETYVLKGPNKEGDFVAQKLAEVIVTVVDQVDNSPLQGALLSLSGDKSYRSNLQTNEDGRIVFHSLNPSEYFLRPMMKEYSFEPSSMIINVKEGVTANFTLRGKRVAYSSFGIISSLNGESEEKIIVIASGLSNCSHFSEEATSESNGQFRIRGLQPYCSYNVKVKSSLEDRRPIERSTPSSINISVINNDVSKLKFTVFRPLLNMDLLLHLYSENIDVYKSLKIKLTRESPPTTLIHTAKLDSSYLKVTKDNNAGVLVHLPSVPLDDKQYSLHLEGPSQSARNKAHTQYFTANSSFKYIEMEYFTKKRTTEQNIKQTSLWTLVLIFGSLIGLYNIEKTVQIVREQFSKLNIGNFSGLTSSFRRKSNPTDYVIDKNEIDQLVQSINATKRKPKPRKV